MGTMAQIAVYAGAASGVDFAFAAIRQCEQELDIDFHGASALRDSILAQAYFYRERTSDAFNPDIGRVTRLWGFHRDHPMVPSAWAIRRALHRRPRIVDFGGIGKGVAADLAADALRTSGATSALVNLGGNIRCVGAPPCVGAPTDARLWRIAITHPRHPDTAIAILPVPPDAGVATSGDYERFAVGADGRRYHHIIDPRTGWPASRGADKRRIASVTIVAKTATAADAWSTGAFVMGWPDGFRAVEEEPGIDGVFVIEDNHGRCEIQYTSGIHPVDPNAP